MKNNRREIIHETIKTLSDLQDYVESSTASDMWQVENGRIPDHVKQDYARRIKNSNRFIDALDYSKKTLSVILAEDAIFELRKSL